MPQSCTRNSDSRSLNRRSFLALAALGASSLLSACSTESTVDPTIEEEPREDSSDPIESSEPISNDMDAPFSSASRLDKLTEVQRNSINMLNYLVVLMQEIGESKNSRLLTEDIYSKLINNISPDAVDENTLYWISDVLDILQSYRMTSTKRERLHTVYERAQAAASLEAIPDPLALLSAVHSGGLAQFALSVLYMAVDSVASYSSAMTDAESQYLQDGWELDDEESATIHQSRSEMFSYTVQTVSDYGLPGDLALTEEAVEQFVEWEDSEVANRLRFFESRSDVYCALGSYWLLLARSYHEHGEWENCLRAISVYEKLSTHILRRDEPYAKTLSLAIDASENIQDGKHVERAGRWANAILENCAAGDWASRYFAAQVYVSLFGQTKDQQYLSLAFNTALDNANELLPEQRRLNDAYLKPVEHQDGGSNTPIDGINPFISAKDKERMSEIDNYNKMLDEERAIELAPIYDPLLLNLDLIFSIAQHGCTGVDFNEASEIVGASGGPFLIEPLNSHFFSSNEALPSEVIEGIQLDHSKLRVPVLLASSKAIISVTVSSGSRETTFEDWAIERVERETEGDPASFVAVYSSSSASDFAFEDGLSADVTIDPLPERGLTTIEKSFSVIQSKEHFWEYAAIWDDGLRFEAK